MKNFLKQLTAEDKKQDGYTFYFEIDEKKNNIRTNVGVWKYAVQPMANTPEPTPMGKVYDIVIYPHSDMTKAEYFRAVLVEPLEYISNMIDNKFCGMVGLACDFSEKRFAEIAQETVAAGRKSQFLRNILTNMKSGKI